MLDVTFRHPAGGGRPPAESECAKALGLPVALTGAGLPLRAALQLRRRRLEQLPPGTVTMGDSDGYRQVTPLTTDHCLRTEGGDTV